MSINSQKNKEIKNKDHCEKVHIARSMRPRHFSEIVGQEQWVKFIQFALSTESMLPVCIIFGPSGVGKTTIARLIAMWECCADRIVDLIEPCGKCSNCQAIVNDAHPDVIEFDAGTYTGVDDLKAILDNMNYKTIFSKKRVYILDEVHMLSRNAVSSLLKIFESKLEDVQFILATTNPEKLPETIMSRGFRVGLGAVEVEKIIAYLIKIAEQVSVKIEPAAAELIAKASKGSVRQALSTLEQCKIMQEGYITKGSTEAMLGLVSDEVLDNIIDSLERLDLQGIMPLVSNVSHPMNCMKQILGAIRTKMQNQQASNTLIEIGYSLAEASMIMHKSPLDNLLEILLGKAIIDRMPTEGKVKSGSEQEKIISLARDLFG